MPKRQNAFETIEARRRELGLSQAALAKLSGVSLPTVHRILAGHGSAASFENVFAIAQTLGMNLEAVSNIGTEELLEQQAQRKAVRLAGMVQGTSALEGQGVSRQQKARMFHKTVEELLAGSRRRLWAE